ncbi:B12-binding domain-containing radical SAM protein [Dissulfurispira thermophila]|uniref:B12-binding domain-containing radical SAM protein n=1 Tax=Dissulfurispira thermophila TaxID=2715679 RepID=A0A7G1H1X4_9BACT|nr:B12-binding domain-containing radical SAM protein [Dissulfurispira thermophila]
MKLNVLLINPWIYDFAAYNMWSRPLGLLKVAEHLSQFDVEVKLIDCTDSFTIKKYGSGKFKAEIIEKPELLKDIPLFYKRYGISIDEFVNRIKLSTPFDIVVITSIMGYWYPGIQKAIEIIRDIAGDVPIILGGIYATIYHEHAVNNSNADFIYKGHMNESFNFALYTFGFKLKKKREQIPYYKLGLYREYPFAPLLTATGCPFRCSYCASNLLYGKYQRHSVESVLKDITELYSIGVRDFAFYDDALLFDADNHIKPILKEIIKSGLDIRLHTPNGLHARFLDEELAALMKRAGFKTIRLSLETINADRQDKTGGKVSNEDLKKAVKFLKQQGFTKQDIGVYLMYGLPGQELEEVRAGAELLKTLDVKINLTEFSPIKGTEAFEELVNRGIINNDIDPLLTNNTVFSYLYSNYDMDELRNIKLDVKQYNSA